MRPVVFIGIYLALVGFSVFQSASAANWEGKWAFSSEVCKIMRDSSGLYLDDPTPIELNRSKFEGLEFMCDVVHIGAVQDELSLRLKCSAEGNEYEDHILVKVTDGKLRLRRVGEEVVSFISCN
jgi:hypothetical protein